MKCFTFTLEVCTLHLHASNSRWQHIPTCAHITLGAVPAWSACRTLYGNVGKPFSARIPESDSESASKSSQTVKATTHNVILLSPPPSLPSSHILQKVMPQHIPIHGLYFACWAVPSCHKQRGELMVIRLSKP